MKFTLLLAFFGVVVKAHFYYNFLIKGLPRRYAAIFGSPEFWKRSWVQDDGTNTKRRTVNTVRLFVGLVDKNATFVISPA